MTKNDDIVFVFENPSTREYVSCYSNLLTILEAYKILAYDEYNEILYYGNEPYHLSNYDFNKIFSSVLYTETEFFTYKRNHQDRLAKEYPDAPVIAVVGDSNNDSSIKTLNVAGINFSITRH